MSKELLEVFDMMDDIVTDELRDLFSHRSPSPTEIKNAKEAVCLLKEAHELKVSLMMEENADDYYSRDYRYSGNRSYMRGRDSDTGRYMSRDNRVRHSYDDMESGHSINDRLIANIEDMMDLAKTDYEKQQLSDWIKRIEAESK